MLASRMRPLCSSTQCDGEPLIRTWRPLELISTHINVSSAWFVAAKMMIGPTWFAIITVRSEEDVRALCLERDELVSHL